MNLFGARPRILLVCTENICRSPMAEGLLRHYLAEMGLGKKVEVASAGTVVRQPGRRPDPRGQKVTANAGIDISRLKARRIAARDFERSEMIVAMDAGNLQDLRAMCPPGFEDRLSLLMSYSPDSERAEIPDPYYGSTEGFETVFEIIDAAVYKLVPHIVNRFG